MARRRLEIEIAADTTRLNAGLARAEGSLRGFGRNIRGRSGRTSVLADALGLSRGNVIATAAVGAVGLATVAIKGSIRAAKEAQVAQAGLRQALKASGVDWARNRAQIDKVVQSTSKIAGIDDEEVTRSFANLVRTTGSVAKATRDVALAANISRARHISLASATKIVEKAEIGQLRGLKTVGVQLRKNASSTEAITAAQKKFAGSAVAFGNTAEGAQAKLGVAFENLQERLGQKLLPLLTKLSLALVDLIDWAEKNWPRFAKAIQPAVRVARVLLGNLVDRIKDVVKVFEGVIKVIDGLIHGRWGQVWAGLKQVVVNELKLIYDTFLKLPARLLGALGQAAFRGLSKIGVWIKDAILDGLSGLAHAIISTIQGAINKAIAAINKLIAGANKAIGAINALPGIDIGKIPSIGAVGGTRARGPVTGPAPAIPPPIGSTGGGIFGRATTAIHLHGPVTVNTDNPEGLVRGLNKYVNQQTRGRLAGVDL